MRFERLVIEAGASGFRLEMHPAMTVVAGAGRLERDGLVGELLGSLGEGRDGVHTELVDDSGRRLAMFRPPGGRHCVVDVEGSLDVTYRFLGPTGRPDLLARAGLDARAARALLRMDATSLMATSQHDDLVRRLAHVDQARLWDVARKVRDHTAEVDELTAAAGGAGDDAAVLEDIERRHAELEATEAQLEDVRTITFLVAGVAGIALLPATAMFGLVALWSLTAVAMGAALTSAWWWWRSEQARRREEDALRDAGASSYLAFSVRRVNGLVVDDHQRESLAAARKALTAAQAQWELLAGDVPVDWALEQRREITSVATGLRRAAGVRQAGATHLPLAAGPTAGLHDALAGRLEALRTAGPGGESLPLVLDDAFGGLLRSTKADLLGQLLAASSQQQIIYLTDDPAVADWARVEALTGALRLVEPKRAAEQRAAERRGRSFVA